MQFCVAVFTASDFASAIWYFGSISMSLSKASMTPLTPEERRLLQELLARAELPIPDADTEGSFSLVYDGSEWKNTAAMMDACKRRQDVSPERPLRTASGYTGFNVGDAPPPMPTTEMTFGSTRRGQVIKLPPGINSLEMWGRTVLEFGKNISKGWTYAEILDSPDKEAQNYVKWNRGQGLLKDFCLYVVAAAHPNHQGPIVPGTSYVRKIRWCQIGDRQSSWQWPLFSFLKL